MIIQQAEIESKKKKLTRAVIPAKESVGMQVPCKIYDVIPLFHKKKS